MSYLTHANDPRRRTKAIVAAGAIHAVLAYGLVTGLGFEPFDRPVPPPLVGEQIPLPPPPPPPDPDTPPDTPLASNPVAPVPPLPLGPLPESQVDPFDGTADPITSVLPDPGPQALPPSRPTPGFTPRRAVPSNNSAGWISNDDYPRRALVDEAEGSVGYRLVIGTSGRVSSCELTRPSGNRALDDATCRLITSRARFEPATDESGAKVLGTYTGSVRWQIPD